MFEEIQFSNHPDWVDERDLGDEEWVDERWG